MNDFPADTPVTNGNENKSKRMQALFAVMSVPSGFKEKIIHG
jgi:hypothetical protein